MHWWGEIWVAHVSVSVFTSWWRWVEVGANRFDLALLSVNSSKFAVGVALL